ncbi:peptidylprolyl isomerase [Mariniblastus fucicola]|uniref:Foldase protein PrsA 1 n=1 Tax=Mariniblastus fucicola TaxID=980251 RepID=A0A5B9P5C1_9BACT|nr:peptidylprolyl isomerase [Mariniblastus fucicola]QEG20699.1 Foldase protein PrsA 1 precursor [Mariniblastus fucicola]
MASPKVCKLTPHNFGFACLIAASLFASSSSGQSVEPTPDPYFKPTAKKPDFQNSYVPPTFSPGSIGKRLPQKIGSPSSSLSVPWSHERSIVRDQASDDNGFKPKSGVVDPPGKIQLVSGTEPVAKQEGIRVAELPTKKKIEPLKTFEPGRVVAIVGGEPIFVGDMLFEVNQIIESKIPQAPESAKQVQRQKLLTMLTKKFVDQKMLFVDAMGKLPAEANIDDLVKQASNVFNEQVLPQMMESSGVKNISEFDGNLRAQGSSLRQVRTAWAKDQLARQFVQQDMKVDQTVTHQEMLDDYLANKEKYAVRARSKWEQVMVRFDKHESRTAAKRKIAELGNQIIYGASFSEIAKKHSDGFRASKGGQHDWTGKGALVLKEIDAAIFELPIGELSDIIESRDGYHIVRVLERTDATHTPFTEAQIEIQKRIKNDKINAAFEKHLERVRERIPVEYFPLD